MLTVEALKNLGINTDEGLNRCLNNEAFYLRLVAKCMQDEHFDLLEEAVGQKRLKDAFEHAHSLKGVVGNLSLTTLYEPIAAITELLRAGTNTDYSGYLEKIRTARNAIVALSV